LQAHRMQNQQPDVAQRLPSRQASEAAQGTLVSTRIVSLGAMSPHSHGRLPRRCPGAEPQPPDRVRDAVRGYCAVLRACVSSAARLRGPADERSGTERVRNGCRLERGRDTLQQAARVRLSGRRALTRSQSALMLLASCQRGRKMLTRQQSRALLMPGAAAALVQPRCAQRR
jgi:hypothetical protein